MVVRNIMRDMAGDKIDGDVSLTGLTFGHLSLNLLFN